MPKPIPKIAKFMTTVPISLESRAKLTEAHAAMRENKVRHLPIVDDGVLLGLLSLSDLHLIETLKDVNPAEVEVRDAMTREPFSVSCEAPIDEVADEMAERKIGSAIVLDAGRVVGIFTATDALRALADTVRTRSHG